jgi:hypothetical protein
MTEDRWLTSDEPRKLLDHVEVYLKAARTKVGRRKLRLFGCACCRRFPDLLAHQLFRRVLETVERDADGLVSREHAAALLLEVQGPLSGLFWLYQQAIRCVLAGRPQQAAGEALLLRLAAHRVDDERRAQANLVREIWGNPFRPVTVSPAWLKWNDGLIPALARSIYDERAYDRLPVLADALEDAGCRSEQLLDHLRSPGPHIRGCWALDRLLKLG